MTDPDIERLAREIVRPDSNTNQARYDALLAVLERIVRLAEAQARLDEHELSCTECSIHKEHPVAKGMLRTKFCPRLAELQAAVEQARGAK